MELNNRVPRNTRREIMDDYIPFMEGVKSIFIEKMAQGKASPVRGWDGRKMLAEIVEEQQLTPAETDVAWGIFTVDIL